VQNLTADDSGVDRQRPRALAMLGSVYLLTAVFVMLSGVSVSSVSALLAFPLIWLSAVDLHRMEIPDVATLMIAGIGLGFWSSDIYAISMNAAFGLAATLGLAGAGRVAWSLTGREWLGLGDAKLIGAGAIVVGAEHLWVMMLLACCGGISVALFRRGRDDRREIPFGPFLAYAIFVTHLTAGRVA
jgi:leader peptidase (prepilin peptidase) / N-methyltransferase